MHCYCSLFMDALLDRGGFTNTHSIFEFFTWKDGGGDVIDLDGRGYVWQVGFIYICSYFDSWTFSLLYCMHCLSFFFLRVIYDL